ncbi:MAG TPA: choice-of-anchor Q domain-containing protein [Lacibacter sp.]|nr:choice-of-anchor Q domain-containing protein [Lacibacter sp.]HMP87329.1 choice-of-anchor Q domain-containing protein [Lacibacter sp.]
MKQSLFILLLLGTLCVFSCRKDTLTSKEARISLSADSLQFDTVFTSAGSTTRFFLIKNENRQAIRLTQVQLIGGSASPFRMNVDGTPGTQFNDVEIEGNDSLYVFVKVNVTPNAQQQPFVLRDSIAVEWNNNRSYLQLEAWGQNAVYLRNVRLQGNQVWNNQLPYVILGGLVVDTNATLTIQPGTRIHLNADAPLLVDGTLRVQGTKTDSVVFQSNRLDEPYRGFPGSWPGIYFRGSSRNNELTHARILNAYQGIVAEQPSGNAQPKVILNNCILDNIFDVGLLGFNSSITANNCLISNCGNNIALVLGGNYQFNHCTVVSISNSYVTHKNPVVVATNFTRINNQLVSAPLLANFTNCIIWGSEGFVENEILVRREGTDPADVQLRHVLFRARTDPQHTSFVSVIRNINPAFDSVDVVRRFYDFRLQAGSPALNAGTPTSLLTDLNGLPRVGAPDLGCFERQ